MSLMDFADAVMPEDMGAWGQSIMRLEENPEDGNGEKKN